MMSLNAFVSVYLYAWFGGDTVLVVLTMYIILAIWKRLPGDIFVLI